MSLLSLDGDFLLVLVADRIVDTPTFKLIGTSAAKQGGVERDAYGKGMCFDLVTDDVFPFDKMAGRCPHSTVSENLPFIQLNVQE